VYLIEAQIVVGPSDLLLYIVNIVIALIIMASLASGASLSSCAENAIILQ